MAMVRICSLMATYMRDVGSLIKCMDLVSLLHLQGKSEYMTFSARFILGYANIRDHIWLHLNIFDII